MHFRENIKVRPIDGILEIRWHSRAGQGGVTASTALAEVLGMHSKLYTQSFSEYGAEKRGAPVAAFNRIGNRKIDYFHQIENPNIVVLFDATLLNPAELSEAEVLSGIKKNGKILINSSRKEVHYFKDYPGEIWHVNATKIAIDEIGKNIPNIPMLAALIKISEVFPLKEFENNLKKMLKVFPAKIIEGNLKAFERGANEVTQIKK